MAGAPEPLFARALGDDWPAVHAAIRDRYGLTSDDDRVAVGSGRMDRVAAGLLTRPALWLLARRDAAVPESGTDVPFEIRSYAFRDGRGREALALRRSFEFDRTRRFVDVLRWDPDRGRIVDFLGTDGRLAVALDPTTVDGALRFDLAEQWLWVAGAYRRVPAACRVEGEIVDRYDDAAGRFSVEASVGSPLGAAFGFRGTFEHGWEAPDGDGVPRAARTVQDRPLPGN